MKLIFILILFFLFGNHNPFLFSQAPAIGWQKCFGGTLGETGRSIKSTPDGGYIIAGYSYSNDGDVSGGHGSFDYWIIKISSEGAMEWQKSLGGSRSDAAWDIEVTTDGGYIVVGYSESDDGDLISHHGPVNTFDVWVVKLNNSGAIEWQKSYGGSQDEIGNSIRQTNDGGYILIGSTTSNDGDVVGYHYTHAATWDYWVLKISAIGNIEWQKCLGGTMNDIGHSIQQTPDGGYILAGAAQSGDGDIDSLSHHGVNEDYWIIKLSQSGTIQWQRSYGGGNADWAQDIQLSPDGGYVITGRSASTDGDVTPNPLSNNMAYDYWILKLDVTGLLQWQKSYGGTNVEYAWSVMPTADGGYIVAGGSWSYDGNVGGYLPVQSYNVWLTKLTDNGELEWQKSLGSTGWDEANSIIPTDDGGYILTGAGSNNDGDVSGFHGGAGDVWVVKLLLAPCLPTINISASDINICSGAPVTFSSSVSNAGISPSYQWTINGGNVGTNSNSFISTSLNNNDTVICLLTSNALCASPNIVKSDTIVIKVSDRLLPTITIQASVNEVCPGTNVTFTAIAQNAGVSPVYQWKVNGNTVGSNTTSYSSDGLKNGDYVYCEFNSGITGCSVTSVYSDTITMIVYPRPVIQVEPSDTIITSGSQLLLNASITGNISSYQWNPVASLTNPLILSPLTNPLTSNTAFTLNAINTDGCSAEKKVNIRILKPFYMPNAFTPNHDGLNDVFRIPPDVSLTLKEFSIFDRWGKNVFRTEDISKGWDGYNNGIKANMGIYVYFIKGSNEVGNIFLKGTFALIR